MNAKEELKRGSKHSIEELISPSSDDEDHGADVKDEPEDDLDEPEPSEDPLKQTRRKSQEKIASYTEMIARAIFHSENNMSTLQEIYNFLNSKYPVLKSRGKSWKNSVRHTLSLNEWFIKIPRMDNGKCCYWSIHPVYLQRFKRGDFQKQRKTSAKSVMPRKQEMRSFDLSPSCQTSQAPPLYPPDITGGMCPPMFPGWPGLRPFDNMPHLHSYHPYSFGHTNFFPPTAFMDSFPNPDTSFYPHTSSNNNKNSDGEKSSPEGSSPEGSLKTPDIGMNLTKPPDIGLHLSKMPEMGLNIPKGYLECLKFGTPLPPMVSSSPTMYPPLAYGKESYANDLQRQIQLKMENGQL